MADNRKIADAPNATDVAEAGWPPSIVRLVIAGIIAASLGFAVVKLIYPVFVLPPDLAHVPEQAPIEVYQRHDRAQYEVDGKNFAVVFGLAGLLLGTSCVVLCFGLKKVRAIIVAAILATMLGGVGAILSNWLFNNMRETSGRNAVILGISLDGMSQSILGYALLWSLLGLGVGIGVGSAKGASKSVIAGISGFVGGVLASLIYVIATSQISIGTSMNTVLPVTGLSQFCWFVTFSVAVSLCIGLGSGEKKSKPAK